MQIRVRGSSIEFLRSVYDPAKKRSTQKMLGTASIGNSGVPIALQELMTEKELEQAAEYFAKEKAERAAHRTKYKARGAKRDLDAIALAIEEVGLDDVQIEKVFEGLDAVKKAMSKRGYKKPKKAPVKPKAAEMDMDTVSMIDGKTERERQKG